MKRFFLAVIVLLAGFSGAVAQFNAPGFEFGISGGGAQGSNDATDRWVLLGRGYVRHQIAGEWLAGEFGGGYTKLQAWNYWAKTAFADYRLFASPYRNEHFDAGFFAGGGVTKAVYRNGTNYLGAIPFGIFLRSKLSKTVLMNFQAGYYLSLSDSLDGMPRSNADLNPITNGRQDGFGFFELGLSFSLSRKKETHASKVDETTVQLLGPVAPPPVSKSPFAAPTAEDTAAMDSFPFIPSNLSAERVLNGNGVPLLDQIPMSTSNSRKAWRTISFGFNDSTLSREGSAILQEVARALKQNPTMRIEIAGHSDDVGSAANNVKISLARANMVKAWLVKMGVDTARLQPVGRGEAEPIADNSTPGGRAANRRVEFYQVD